MEEREEEYQRARERIFAHDVRAVCVGGVGGGGCGFKGVVGGWVGLVVLRIVCVSVGGWGHVAQIFVSFLFMCKFSRCLATNYHCWIYEF